MLESQGSLNTFKWHNEKQRDETEGAHYLIPGVQTFMCPLSLCHISLSCLWGPELKSKQEPQGEWHTLAPLHRHKDRGALSQHTCTAVSAQMNHLAYIVPEIYASAAV